MCWISWQIIVFGAYYAYTEYRLLSSTQLLRRTKSSAFPLEVEANSWLKVRKQNSDIKEMLIDLFCKWWEGLPCFLHYSWRSFWNRRCFWDYLFLACVQKNLTGTLRQVEELSLIRYNWQLQFILTFNSDLMFTSSGVRE